MGRTQKVIVTVERGNILPQRETVKLGNVMQPFSYFRINVSVPFLLNLGSISFGAEICPIPNAK